MLHDGTLIFCPYLPPSSHGLCHFIRIHVDTFFLALINLCTLKIETMFERCGVECQRKCTLITSKLHKCTVLSGQNVNNPKAIDSNRNEIMTVFKQILYFVKCGLYYDILAPFFDAKLRKNNVFFFCKANVQVESSCRFCLIFQFLAQLKEKSHTHEPNILLISGYFPLRWQHIEILG